MRVNPARGSFCNFTRMPIMHSTSDADVKQDKSNFLQFERLQQIYLSDSMWISAESYEKSVFHVADRLCFDLHSLERRGCFRRAIGERCLEFAIWIAARREWAGLRYGHGWDEFVCRQIG